MAVACLVLELVVCTLVWLWVLVKKQPRTGLVFSLLILATLLASVFADAHHDALFRIGAVVCVLTLYGPQLLLRRRQEQDHE